MKCYNAHSGGDQSLKMDQLTGRVIKRIGGFFTVSLESGEQLLCRARGRLERKGEILTGDLVTVTPLGDEGIIESRAERRSRLIRPPVANVDLAVVVFALTRPDPVVDLLDRILVQAEWEGIEALIVWNKADLAGDIAIDHLIRPYEMAGYRNLIVSAIESRGMDDLKNHLRDRISIFAGPSGVGKSTLLNSLIPSADQLTGEVGGKGGTRGRHTTREVTLHPLPKGGWLADSPGFSVLELANIDPRDLPRLYPEFRKLDQGCRFSGCMHRTEPDCAVLHALSEDQIDRGRYERYIRLLEETEAAFERRY